MTDVAEFCSGIQVGIQGFTAKQIWDSGRDSEGFRDSPAKQIWDSGRDSGIHCEANLGFR